MSILQALCFDNLKSLGSASLPFDFGMLRTGNVYWSSSGWVKPPMIDSNGWLCASDGSGVYELRGQYFEAFVPDKTKVYWFGARFRNISNLGYAPFRFSNTNGSTIYEPLLTNHASLGLAGGTGTPEAFLEIELNYPANLIRYFKDGLQVFEGSFGGLWSGLYAFWTNGTAVQPGLLFKNQTGWTAGGADQYKVRDFSIVVNDGLGVTTRMGPVNIRRAPILVSSVTGADKDVPTSQTVLNQELTNASAGPPWTKAAGAVKLTAATSSVNFKLDLTGITGRKLAAGIIVGAQRASGTTIPVVELSQVVDGTTFKNASILPMANISQDYVSWTNPRSEFAAANVDLATVDFSLTLKDPA